MNKFLETYNLPKLIHDETEHLNRMINKEIELGIKNVPTKIQDQMDSLVNATKYPKKN